MSKAEWDASTRLIDLLPEGFMLLEFSLQAEALDPEGNKVLISTRSKNLTPWNAMGMLNVHLGSLDIEMLGPEAGYRIEEGGDDDD